MIAPSNRNGMQREPLVAVVVFAVVLLAAGAYAQTFGTFGDRFIRLTFDHCVVTAGAGGNPDSAPVCGFAADQAYGVRYFPTTLDLYERLAALVGDALVAVPQEQPPATPSGGAAASP